MDHEDKDRMRRRHDRQANRRTRREERERFRRAREAREAHARDRPRGGFDDEDDDGVVTPAPRTRTRRRTRQGPSPRIRTGDRLEDGEFLARVAAVRRTRLELLDEHGETWSVDHHAGRGLRVVLGDRVIARPVSSDALRLTGRIERRNELRRRDPQRPEASRTIAANVDLGIITVSALAPRWNLGVVDRFLVLLARCGIPARLCVNKMDLADAEERARIERDVQGFAALDLPTSFVSAEHGDGLEPLAAALRGATSVFVGHSGVGKSSLINALGTAQHRRTGQVRAADGKGRHTTTDARLVPLAGGGHVVDTPGVRSIATWDVAPADLAFLFRDFAEDARSCRFADCRHEAEPDCGVRAAVERGALPRPRWEAFLRIRRSLES